MDTYQMVIPSAALKALAFNRGWVEDDTESYKLVAREAIISFITGEYRSRVAGEAFETAKREAEEQANMQLQNLAIS